MMSEDKLHLVKVPLRTDRLAFIARRRGIPLRELDHDYLAHCLMRELWQEMAPAPYVLRGRGRAMDVWGYSRSDRDALIERAREFGDPSVLDAIDDLEAVVAKEMPRFEKGRRIGFRLRSCPIVRLAQARAGHRAGAEIDAFLARCFEAGPDTPVDRQEVYKAWLGKRLADSAATGVSIERLIVNGISRKRMVRRTQGARRKARWIERPDVTFAGVLVVEDSERFLLLLSHGVGRHRTFGFGALMIVPPDKEPGRSLRGGGR